MSVPRSERTQRIAPRGRLPVSPRPEVAAMAPYSPPVEGRRGKLRLDFNENAVGCSPAVLAALRALDAERIATYPEYGPLRTALARHLGVPRDRVLPTNGADEAIHLLVEGFAGAGERVVIPVPTFVMYRFYAEVAGARIVEVPYAKDLSFPEAAVVRALHGAKLALIASPNNPTGTAASIDGLRRILRANPRCLVVVDEAYHEFHGATALPLLARFPNLVVLRTFSKAYGLAGLRLGCAIARSPVLAVLAKVQSPYSVNAVAAAVAPAALADRAFVRRYVAEVRSARGFLRRELAALGIPTWPSQANFVLARFGDDSPRIAAALRAENILVRDRSGSRGLEGCVRLGVGTRLQVADLLGALREQLRRLRGISPRKARR